MMACRATQEQETSLSAATRCNSAASYSVRLTENRNFLAGIATPDRLRQPIHSNRPPMPQAASQCCTLLQRRLRNNSVLSMFRFVFGVKMRQTQRKRGFPNG
jgi:hypothetical protein